MAGRPHFYLFVSLEGVTSCGADIGLVSVVGGQRDSPEGRLAEKCQPALGRGGGGGDSDGAGWGGDSFSQA